MGHACVVKAERLINDLWNFQPVSRKVVIPSGCDYPRLLIGPGGSKLKELQAEAGGRVEIHVRDGMNVNGWHDKNERPYLLVEGEASCVCKAESLIMDMMQIPGREKIDTENNRNFSNTNNYGKSVLDRVHALSNEVGLKFSPDEPLCSKVMRLENEVFSNVKSGTIKERVSFLEKEMGH